MLRANLVGLLFTTLVACQERTATPPAPVPVTPTPVPALSRVEGAKASTPPLKLDFAAYGDCRSDQIIHGNICARILESGARFVVVSGDVVDFGESDEDWKEFNETTRELRAKTQYLVAPGNHDLSLERRFEKEFGLEKPWHDKRIGDVHLFLLDSNLDFDDADQIRWFEEKAKASDAKHKIAAFHHPPFSIVAFGEYESRAIRPKIHPLLVRLKFCAAFCGHDHQFYTTLRDGVRYVITAGGGAVLYGMDPSRAQPGDLYRRFHHFVGCTIGEKSISARVFDPDGVEAPDLAFTLCDHP